MDDVAIAVVAGKRAGTVITDRLGEEWGQRQCSDLDFSGPVRRLRCAASRLRNSKYFIAPSNSREGLLSPCCASSMIFIATMLVAGSTGSVSPSISQAALNARAQSPWLAGRPGSSAPRDGAGAPAWRPTRSSAARSADQFRPKLEVADIFRLHGEAWRTANAGHVSLTQRRVMMAIEMGRTAALGGHVESCQDCALTRARPTPAAKRGLLDRRMLPLARVEADPPGALEERCSGA
jgi:hypothetical protein